MGSNLKKRTNRRYSKNAARFKQLVVLYGKKICYTYLCKNNETVIKINKLREKCVFILGKQLVQFIQIKVLIKL
jgi:hypothetical protein